MSNNKQSSVEWLAEIIRFANKELYAEMFDEIEQAKAMHKEEHGETFTQGVQWLQYQRDLVEGGSEYWDEEPKQFDEYYNETFGDNK